MEDFPKLSESQVAILRALIATGHVVDENFDLAVSNHQKVYRVCDSLETALREIENEKQLRQDIEYVIYNANKEVIKYLS